MVVVSFATFASPAVTTATKGASKTSTVGDVIGSDGGDEALFAFPLALSACFAFSLALSACLLRRYWVAPVLAWYSFAQSEIAPRDDPCALWVCLCADGRVS